MPFISQGGGSRVVWKSIWSIYAVLLHWRLGHRGSTKAIFPSITSNIPLQNVFGFSVFCIILLQILLELLQKILEN